MAGSNNYPRLVLSTRDWREGSSDGSETGDEAQSSMRTSEEQHSASEEEEDDYSSSSSDSSDSVVSEDESELASEAHQPSRSSSTRSSIASSSQLATSCFREVKLSLDGSYILTTSHDRTLRTWPTAPSEDNEILQPSSIYTSPEPIRAFAVHPAFNPYDATTTHVVLSARDQPIRVINPLLPPQDQQVSSYAYFDPINERCIAPTSLIFDSRGDRIITGSESLISTFDFRTLDIKQGPRDCHHTKKQGFGIKSAISAMSVNNDDVLAVGTWTRQIGLYDTYGTPITTFSLPKSTSPPWRTEEIVGTGITQLKFSPCGTYLYVAERSSDTLLLYDIRTLRLCLAYLSGRSALTNQKLGFDIFGDSDSASSEVSIWAGGTDGRVRVWRTPYQKQGAVLSEFEWDTGADMPVAGICVMPDGQGIVTASGSLDVGGKGEGRRIGGGETGTVRVRDRGVLGIWDLSVSDPMERLDLGN